MPFTSSMRFAATILTIISAASAIRLQWRHDGRSHQGAHDAVAPALQPRQLNGAAGGIQPVSSRSPRLAVSLSTGMPTSSGSLTLTSTLSFEYTSLATGTFTRPATPTGEVNAYIFPSSMIQVPVATICPDTPSILLNTTAGSGLVSATAFLPNGSSTVYLSTPTHPANSFNASSYTPVPLPSPISVCYPDTDPNCPSEPNATFSVTPIPLPTANAANATGNDAAERVILDSTARILLDDRGCQTVYSPSYTALCRTTVQLAGMPEATVTDCAQWVTFSSDTKGCSDAATTSVGGPEARDDIEGNDRGSTTALPTTMAEVTPSMGSALPMMTVKPGTYYAAHWVDLSRGGVPANVRVEECEAERACHTFREKWSESKATGVLVKESVASFEGVSTFLPFPRSRYRHILWYRVMCRRCADGVTSSQRY